MPVAAKRARLHLTSAVAKLLRLMSPRDRRRLPWLLIAIVVMAVLQTITIASIMPFLAVITRPDVVESNRFFQQAYLLAGSPDMGRFLFVLGCLVLVLLLVSNVVSVLVTWLLLRFSHSVGYRFSRQMLSDYLHRPYGFFLGRNSTELSKNLLSETDRVTWGVLLPMLTVVARGVSIVFIIGLLVAANPLMAVSVGTVLGIVYLAIYMSIRRRAFRLGRRATEASRRRFKITAEAFGVIKYLKLTGMEDLFTERFARPSREYARCHASSRAVVQLPKFLLEVVAFGGVLATVLYLLSERNAMNEALSLLGLYAFAGYKLLPQLQQVFDVATNLRFNMPALDVLLADMIVPETTPSAKSASSSSEIVTLRKSLQLKHVTFRYPGSDKPTIEDMNVTIPAGSTIGLAGSTGAGKTTVADIILGLLTPDFGDLLVDSTRITAANVRSWQRNLSYVPQQIYLADDTICRNIAFGRADGEIDRRSVERAARVAQIHDFIVHELPDGFDTMVGERGVRLSGGEQQRIGIARALYSLPNVLVLDEATGALDTVTERAVLRDIGILDPELTIIMVTHRLGTLSACDRIYFLEDGKMTASGSFADLLETSPRFADMAQAVSR